jgi:hypothetical protein
MAEKVYKVHVGAGSKVHVGEGSKHAFAGKESRFMWRES